MPNKKTVVTERETRVPSVFLLQHNCTLYPPDSWRPGCSCLVQLLAPDCLDSRTDRLSALL